MYKTASKFSQKQRSGSKRKYIRPNDSPRARFIQTLHNAPKANLFSDTRVRIYHTPGTKDRATKAREELISLGASVNLIGTTPSAAEKFAGKIYYFPQQHGYPAVAYKMALSLKRIEPLSVANGSLVKARRVDYSIWIC